MYIFFAKLFLAICCLFWEYPVCAMDLGHIPSCEDCLVALYQEASQNNGFEIHRIGESLILISPDGNNVFANSILGEISPATFSYIQNFFPQRKFRILIDSNRNDLQQVATENGYHQILTLTDMVFDISNYQHQPVSQSMTITKVNSPEELSIWCSIKNEVFSCTCDFFENCLQSPHIIRYIGYYNGEPVATARMHIFDHVLCIYVIAVKKEFRRLGIGQAMVQECLLSTYAKNAKYMLLSATEMGKPLYLKMGVQPIGEKRYFVRA